MELKYKDMIKALNAIEDERKIPEEVIIDALKEAMAKAYKKNAELSDINVEATINEKKQTIDIYQIYNVVEDVEDDELEMSLEDAHEIDSSVQIGDTVRRKVEITSMSRAAATLAKNVMRQKIREAEKIAVYSEYIDQLNDMVLGIVESVKDKFTLINLGKTVAMMPHSAEIPGERLREGQKIRVIISEVNKDTKGSQVLVSRADAMLVKRLFEKEVPEIFQGIVEIKAIAREAGERTKMAVYSRLADVDPIGACIGQRGARVQEIIEELHGEKIDIFQWSNDITQLVKNALAPAEIDVVIPGDDKSLLVIVPEDQLSLAIGKKGKNARLAVKLTNRKIDIKTRQEIEAMGKDYDALVAEAQVKKEAIQKELEEKEMQRIAAEEREAEKKRIAAAQALAEKQGIESTAEAMNEEVLSEEMQEVLHERIQTETFEEIETPVEIVEKEAEETEMVEEVMMEEKVTETPKPIKQEVKKSPKANLEEIASKNEYVSVFEKLANTNSKPKQSEAKAKKKKCKGEEEFKVRNKVLEAQLRKELVNADIKPIYTEEELEEIERQQELEEESQYDIDYDEYEDYYRDDEDLI